MAEGIGGVFERWRRKKSLIDAAAEPVARRHRLRIIEGPAAAQILGSDIRSSNAEGFCRLCQKHKPLRLSHIAPKWAYKWMKAEGAIHGSDLSQGVVFTSQDGDKHYLLCSECELWLGVGEDYLATLSKASAGHLRQIGVVVHPGPIVSNVNASLIRRAIVGILLKYHWAPDTTRRLPKLASPLAEALRKSLLEEEFPASQYPLIGTKWHAYTVEGMNPRSFIMPGYKNTILLSTFDILMGGWSWTLVLRDPLRRLAPFVAQYEMPSDGGPWRIMLADILEAASVVAKYGTTPDELILTAQDYAAEDKCPCGLDDRPFRECCSDIWCRNS
jgi:hypothetical protein